MSLRTAGILTTFQISEILNLLVLGHKPLIKRPESDGLDEKLISNNRQINESLPIIVALRPLRLFNYLFIRLIKLIYPYV